MGKKSYKFKSEATQLLDIVIHSLYSNKEIFLRELISNASDALDKLRIEALTDPSLKTEAGEIRIQTSQEGELRTLELRDNGIGMSRDEVVSNLGTIARSGTREFIDRLKEAQDADQAGALIGQFGVGFYASFMVAERVEVVTRRAGEESATRWISEGSGRFSVDDAERADPGTSVKLFLRPQDPADGLPDFSDEWILRRVVKKYSDFVTYPISLQVSRPSGEGEDAAPELQWDVLNSMKPLWTRPDGEPSDEEYAEFYKHISGDWNAPLHRVAFKAEGTFEYSALLFIPESRPFDLFYRDASYGLQLYVNRVQIMERSEDLLPYYLRFVKGVVDSPDFSLNVSRELLQQDHRVEAVKKRVARKVLESLEALKADEPERYRSFWDSFGPALKEGIPMDSANHERLLPLLMFQSSRDPEAVTTLPEYIERMKEDQEVIYYLSGESRAAVEASPHLEAFKERGYEVIYFVDPVDELMVSALPAVDDHKLQSVGKGTVKLGSDSEQEEAEKQRVEQQEVHASLLEAIQVALDEHIKEVRLSTRLTTSVACLVGDEDDISPHLEQLLKRAGQAPPSQKRILELNPEHALLEHLQQIYGANAEDRRIPDYSKLLYGQALLVEGSALPDATGFAQLVTGLMVQAAA